MSPHYFFLEYSGVFGYTFYFRISGLFFSISKFYVLVTPFNFLPLASSCFSFSPLPLPNLSLSISFNKLTPPSSCIFSAFLSWNQTCPTLGKFWYPSILRFLFGEIEGALSWFWRINYWIILIYLVGIPRVPEPVWGTLNKKHLQIN